MDPLLLPDEATAHFRGLADAPVTLIEYGDFECPSCLQAHGALSSVRSTPAFYVNGVFADVSFGLNHLHEAIDRALPCH
ncbi:thioredoxin domain-containing protein [Polaromonas sp.]|uniref:thioredoxin domain-containing protein n=1 Tax=Polaromonas sp. TaxID=1869339 RepID=UPI003BB67C3B